METNKALAVSQENNLPEVIEDKFGNKRTIPVNPRPFDEIATARITDLTNATKKLSEALHNLKNLNNKR